MLGMVALVYQELQQLPAALAQVGQLLLLCGGRSRCVGLEGAAIVRQDGGVNRIRLGPFTLGAGEVTNAPGFQNTDGDAGGVRARATGCS